MQPNTKRLSPAARHAELIAAACRIAVTKGYTHVTRDDIALACGVSPSLVSHVLGTMPAMRRSLMRAAVANEILPVIAQGLAMHDPHAMRAPQELKQRAAGAIAL